MKTLQLYSNGLHKIHLSYWCLLDTLLFPTIFLRSIYCFMVYNKNWYTAYWSTTDPHPENWCFVCFVAPASSLFGLYFVMEWLVEVKRKQSEPNSRPFYGLHGLSVDEQHLQGLQQWELFSFVQSTEKPQFITAFPSFSTDPTFPGLFTSWEQLVEVKDNLESKSHLLPDLSTAFTALNNI